MKGITGHRIHDAYTNMAPGAVGGVKGRPAQTPEAARRPPAAEAATVQISDGARRLAEGQEASDPERVAELKEKVKAGPSAFNPAVVAQRMVAELGG